jgi:intracellular sulfur oxidation DsrE/DsrF family protein
MKKLYIQLLALLLTFGFATGAAAYDKQKAAYHVNYYDAKRQTGALRNIQNHINAVGAENIDVRVVMHGNGLSLLLYPEEVKSTKMKGGNANDKMQATIANLKSQGVKFSVCANTLKGRKVSLDQLYDAEKADIVPSGVAEIAHLQSQGFAYMRP